jgi:phosphoribosylglycinamide formyltransferase-1
MLKECKLAIFASGTGTNALALKKTYQDFYGQSPLILTDNPNSPLSKEGMFIPFTTKEEHEASLLRILFEHKIDWIFLAGYMRVLSPKFISTFAEWHEDKNQILNIHPSLLPKYKGKDAYRQAWESNDTHTGVSVHYVTEELDSGDMLIQIPFQIRREVGLQQFIEESKKIENDLYMQVLRRLFQEEIRTVKFNARGSSAT